MCCSRASLAWSAFTRASDEIRSSRWYSSFGDVPICRRSSCTAFEKVNVAAEYSSTSRVFSSQIIALRWRWYIGQSIPPNGHFFLQRPLQSRCRCSPVDSALNTALSVARIALGATGRPLLAKTRLRYDKYVMKLGRTDQRASQTQVARS
jgi:hypothetical protein